MSDFVILFIFLRLKMRAIQLGKDIQIPLKN